MINEYSVTFSGSNNPDALHAHLELNIACDWSDTLLIEAESPKEALSKAVKQSGYDGNKVKIEVKLIQK